MSTLRASQQGTASVEPEIGPSGQEDIHALAASGSHREMGHFELTVVAGAKVKPHLSLQNRFSALSEEGDEADCPHTRFALAVPGVAPKPLSTYDQDFPSLSSCGVKSQTLRVPAKKWIKRSKPLPMALPSIPETSNLESNGGEDARNTVLSPPGFEISSAEGTQKVELTIDSGAAEHVVSSKHLPHLPVLPSAASMHGVTYTMGNGTKTENLGEQHVNARTALGQTCKFTAQVTDPLVRPLMSVGRICDGGHRVVFDTKGGYIQSVSTGERIHFRREGNVYRLDVEVPGVSSGFAGQGRSARP